MNSLTKWIVKTFASIALILPNTACEPEGRVLPVGKEQTDSQALITDEFSGIVQEWAGILVDHSGRKGTGSVYEANHYGEWLLKVHGQSLECSVTCGRGWYLDQVWAWVGEMADRPVEESGKVLLGSFPFYKQLRPMMPGYSIHFPLAEVLVNKELALMLKLELVELDFLGSPFHPTEVWAEGEEWEGTVGAKVVSLGRVGRDTAVALLGH